MGVHVSGNNLISLATGKPLLIVGPNFSGLEQQGPGGGWDGIFGLPSSWYAAYAKKWSVNGQTITGFRFPFNSYWLVANPATAAAYQAGLQKVAAAVTGAGLVCNFDMHWDAPNTTAGAPQQPYGQCCMPTADWAVKAWVIMANLFKDNLLVTFELMNEPYGSGNYSDWVAADGVSPGVDAFLLRDGGSIQPFKGQDNHGVGFSGIYNGGAAVNIVGFNAIIAAIRTTGAKNVIWSSPIGWAGEIETFLASMPTDPAGQMGCSWHVYGYSKGADFPLAVKAKIPLLITEFYSFDANFTGGAGSNAGLDVCQTNGIGYMWWGVLNNWNGLAAGPLATAMLAMAPWASSPTP